MFNDRVQELTPTMKSTRDSDKENQYPNKCENNQVEVDYFSNNPVDMSSANKNVDDNVIETLLEKLRSCLPKISENGETVRSALSKIYLRVISSDRRIRERTLEILWNKESSAMELFIILLEMCKDNAVTCSITGILHESISPRTTKVKLKGTKSKHSTSKNITRTVIAQLIHFGGTQVFLKLLISSQRADSTMTEILVQETLWMLGQIAQKDQKFATKVRLLNITKLFHSLIKQHYNDSKLLLPLLLILKSLAKNTFAVQILIKDGIISVLEKTFVCIGYSPHLKLKILLECFKYFTTIRLGCSKFVKVGMVHMLTRIFDRWDKWDGPIKQKIANYALCTLHHLCSIKSGRKSIKANNGLQLLHRFCTNCPDIKAYDSLLSRVCGIINQCLEKKELPVPEMSPARFNLPNGDGKRANSVESCNSDIESQANSINSLGRICSDIESGDDDDDNDDDDDDDDDYDDDLANEQQQQKINSRMARNKLEQMNEINNIDETQFFASVITSQRSTDDLLGYNVLFTEQNDFKSQRGIEIRSESDNTITNDTINENNIKRSQVLKHVKSCDSNNWQRAYSELDTEKKQLSNNDYPRQLKLLDSISKLIMNDDKLIYCNCASRIRSVIPFVKVAYPDLVGGNCYGDPEPLNDKVKKVCRTKLLNNVDRGLRANSINHETIFDLDALTTNVYSIALSSERLKNHGLNNFDDERIGNRSVDIKSLQFESRFESGNLRKAIQIGAREYDLILTPDVNSASRHQWFYFEVSNMEANISYTFNIVNCEKANSQFNFGMKPILFSVMEARLGRSGWIRTGVDICYYRNCYRRPCKGRNYLTTSFTVTFPHSYDVCYLAYHFPYTYSQLMTHIWKWLKISKNQGIYFQAVTLCDTLNDNECPLLTITNVDSKINPISKRKNIFLTSRVHPGESNASWVMHGTLEALLSDTNYAKSLRDDYVFKIVPMLNIEGVINGCNRYGLTNEDLNRRWSNPNRILHPVIYHTKGLMEYCSRVLHRPPHVFVDYHGHSRRKNVFLFGCSRSSSWSAADREKSDQPVQYLMLPRLMQKTSPAFALPLCSFKVERNKESTARVAIWRQLGVARSYTMESSFCGCDQGPLAGLHLDTVHLRNVGRDFCQALSFLKDNTNATNNIDNWSFEKFIVEEELAREEKCTDTELSSSCDSDDTSCGD